MQTISQASVSAAVELLQLKEKQLEFLQNHKIYRFAPENEDQLGFILSKAHVRLGVGSNRSGKTHCGAEEDVSFALGFRPWMLPEEYKKKNIKELLAIPWENIPEYARTPIKPPVRVLIIAEDWEKADEIFVSGNGRSEGKLTALIPKDAIANVITNAQGYVCGYKLINGSLINLDTQKSFDNNPMSFEGGSYTAVHYDEPKKRDLRIALSRGLVDNYGYEWFTYTPWKVARWLVDDLVSKVGLDPEIEMFKFQTEKNTKVNQAGWQAFLKTLTEDELLVRGKGEHITYKGLVYPEFIPRAYSKGGNILDTSLEWEWIAQNGTVYVSIDPHPRQPQAAVFMSVDQQGRMICFDEIFKRMLIPELCAAYWEKLTYASKLMGQSVEIHTLIPEIIIGDPIMFQEDPVDCRRWADEFHNFDPPIDIVPASKRKEAGIAAVRHALKDRTLLVTPNCARIIYEFTHYIYSEWEREDRNQKEKPVDRDDHMMECIYRLVLLGPAFIRRTNKKPIIGKPHCR